MDQSSTMAIISRRVGKVYNITVNLSVISLDDAIKIGRIVRAAGTGRSGHHIWRPVTDSQRILDAAESKEGRFYWD
ncbi:hypothetical protein ACNKHU_20845 [Shigella flexneri]